MHEDREVSSNVQVDLARMDNRRGEGDQGGWAGLVPVGCLERGSVSFMTYCEWNVGFQPTTEQVSVSSAEK